MTFSLFTFTTSGILLWIVQFATVRLYTILTDILCRFTEITSYFKFLFTLLQNALYHSQFALYPYKFATRCRKPLIIQGVNFSLWQYQTDRVASRIKLIEQHLVKPRTSLKTSLCSAGIISNINVHSLYSCCYETLINTIKKFSQKLKLFLL